MSSSSTFSDHDAEPIAPHLPLDLPSSASGILVSVSVEEDPSELSAGDDQAVAPVIPLYPVPSHPFIPLLSGDPYAMPLPMPLPPPSHRPFRYTPGGVLHMHTPRKRASQLPSRKRSLSPTASSTVPPSPSKRQQSTSRPWGWMSDTLQSWRVEEGLPSTFEIGESSQAPRPIFPTGEPVESTVPLLVVRSTRLGHQLISVSESVGAIEDATETLARRFAHQCHVSEQIVDQIRTSMGATQRDVCAHGLRISELGFGTQALEERLAAAELRAQMAEQRMDAHLERYFELIDILVSLFPPPP